MMPQKLIAQGRTADIYEYGSDKVLKLFHTGFPEGAIEYEYNVSMRLAENQFHVPRVYELVKHESRLGIIYEKINGATLMGRIAAKPWKIIKYAKLFAQLHYDLQKPVECNLADFTNSLIDNIYGTKLLDESEKTWLKDYIQKLPCGDILCHGDLHPENILIANGKSSVIDWMTASKGCRAADIARTMLLLKYGDSPGQKSRLEILLIKLFRNMYLNEYIKHYIKISGVGIKEIEKWELPVAAARLADCIPQSEKEALLGFVRERLI